MQKSEYTIDELVHNESFQKWVNGIASKQEKQYWDDWVMENPHNRWIAIQAQNRISGFSLKPSSQPSAQRAWDNLQNVIERDNSAYKKPVDASGIKSVKWFFRIAASFVLLLISGLAISTVTPGQMETEKEELVIRNEIITEYGERKAIALNDGSKIILNAHSNLVYTVDTADSNAVEVFLDGEAYFSVAKRKDEGTPPFRVRTSAGFIKVMGTKFVVSTRNRDTQVVLEEGEVTLNPLNQDKEAFMEPGQLALFDSNSDSIHLEQVNTEVYTSWQSPVLVFEATPFSDVIDRLEDTYGVKVVVRDASIYERKITGSIENSSLNVITSALSKTLDIPIELSDSAVYIGGRTTYPD